jgi:hypothetical protein
MPIGVEPNSGRGVSGPSIPDATATTTSGVLPTLVYGENGGNVFKISAAQYSADGVALGNILRVAAAQYVSTGAATADRLRTPIVFKPLNLGAATAETTVWTPTSGKKFRLMRLVLTAGAATTLTFNDGTGGTLIFTLGAGATAIFVDLGNGILSAAANNLLTVIRSVSATLIGTLMGTEE